MLIDQSQVINKLEQRDPDWFTKLRQSGLKLDDLYEGLSQRVDPGEFIHPSMKVFERLEEDALQVRQSVSFVLLVSTIH
jgi:hypothetical protein